jgi:hypothetical protein
MASRLTVVFYIILCLEAGMVLTIAPWVLPWFGLSDWGDNYLLLYAARTTGLQGLQTAIASGWVRGAVTGLGLLNLAMAFWEAAHFEEAVRRLQGAEGAPAAAPKTETPPRRDADAEPSAGDDHVSRDGRRDDARDRAVE